MFLKKSYRKADTWCSLTWKGISLSEHCLYKTADSCMIAQYILITRAVQTSMLLCTSRTYLYQTMTFNVHGMNQEEPCTDRYIICICHISCTNKYIHCWIHYFSTYHVRTYTYNNILVCSCMFVYILVQTMYIAPTCLACTISLSMNMKIKR